MRIRTRAEWLSGAGAAILDQALVSGANFLLALLLARWMPLPEYGLFAVINSILTFLAGVHSALLLEPMTVLGPARFSKNLHGYLTGIVRINAAMTLPATALLFAIGCVCLLTPQLRTLGIALLGLTVAVPCLLFFQMNRRFCYLDHRPQRAVGGSALYAGLLGTGTVILGVRHWATPATAFLVTGASALCAALILIGRLRTAHVTDASAEDLEWRTLWRDHWQYGRWILLASLTFWGSTEIYYSLTAWHVGLQETAALRALQNLIAPVLQAMAALGTLLLPWMSAVHAESGPRAAMTAARRVTLFMTMGATVYGIILWGVGDAIMRFVYLGRYSSHQYLLIYIVSLPVLTALASGSQIGLRAVQRPWSVLIAYATSALLTASLGLAMVWRWGVEGAALGLVISLGAYALVIHALAVRAGRSA